MNYCCLFKLLLIDIITLKEPINENIKKTMKIAIMHHIKKKEKSKKWM